MSKPYETERLAEFNKFYFLAFKSSLNNQCILLSRTQA